MTSNNEIYLSYLCDQILAACNRIHKKLDEIDEHQHAYHEQSSDWPVASAVPQPPYSHPPLVDAGFHPPHTQPPDPPDWKQPYQPYNWGATDQIFWNPRPQQQPNPGPPSTQPSWRHSEDLLYEHPIALYNEQQLVQASQPSCWELGPPDKRLYAAAHHHHRDQNQPPYGYGSAPTSDREPCRQFSEPSSWFEMPQYQVPNSTPTYLASVISPTATTQSHSCHGQPVAVLQPLPCPTSLCRSTIEPLAASTAIPPPPPQPSSPSCFTDKRDDWEVVSSTVVVPNIGDVASISHQSFALATNAHKGTKEDLTPEMHDSNKSHGIEGISSCDAKKLIRVKKDRSLEWANPKDNADDDDLLKENSMDDVEKIRKQSRYGDGIMYSHSGGKIINVGVDTSRPIDLPKEAVFAKQRLCSFHPGGDSSSKLLFATFFVVSWFPP